MGRNRFDDDFDGFRGHRHHRHRGFYGPFGIIDFVFSMVGLGLTIAFNVLGIVISVFTGISNSRAAQQKMNGPQMPPNEEARSEAEQAPPKANMKQSQTIKKEQVKETFKQQKNENTSDWNILLFVLTLIPVIVTLAAKRLDLAGLVAVGGVGVIVVYNIIRGSVIRAKQRKKHKADVVIEEKTEDNELDRVVKEAFDKVYSIRRDIPKIKKQDIQGKLERLCDLAEKIIGEVRANPDCMNSVRKFFYYYLDAFIEVFTKYLKLNNFSEDSEEVQKLLLETEKSFNDMEEIFQEMCEGMLEKDMLNLKATINVLKNSNYNN